MQTRLNPYLCFRSNCREAMELYSGVFGGKLTIGTFKEFGASQDAAEDNLVMHSTLEAENGIVFMASDTPERLEITHGNNVQMSISGDNATEMSAYFEKLSVGGSIRMPLEKAMWGDTFGMLVDRFGIHWLVNISPGS